MAVWVSIRMDPLIDYMALVTDRDQNTQTGQSHFYLCEGSTPSTTQAAVHLSHVIMTFAEHVARSVEALTPRPPKQPKQPG